MYKMEWNIPKNQSGKVIKAFLNEKNISKRMLTDIKYAGGKIMVNHKEVTVRYALQPGDHLLVIFPPEPKSSALVPENMQLDIIYEDKDVLVVNKPSGMSTIPSREHPAGSLANGIHGYYLRHDIDTAIHIVTRLDRDTSGLVLIAKHRHVHHLMSLQQRKREIKRSYQAFAHGVFSSLEGTVDAPIGRKETSIIEREVRQDGKPAVTHFSIINQYEGFAHLHLDLGTGRTHQIRVHMSYSGHPLLGDTLYGGNTERIHRQALHCLSLSFFHPMTNNQLHFNAPLPEDMNSLL
ncbi:RluA family pseudouridine synthase [Rossellomorea vietnamensis]|uniref:Pseudouridine synthase n=1 Tax=Rossellomorea vietnamensis TaxID=218284 RepID=A0A5D4NND7_9BACI|nr:RluA family pseudouridine synthase [Rossellomorea vietnamensis]TYS15813.1 RluA family pseudouridine synthase [Rossellomorea vietnamensis]